ncbi:MAG: tRNA(Ile)-lysidine synthase [Pseudomonadota bacterium]
MRIQAQVSQFLSNAISSNPPPTLLVAFSGGVDSCVLLHALAQAKKPHHFNLQAMHVHHGLSPNADVWAEFCAKTCAAYQVPLEVVKVKVEKNAGLGVEAAAREARYQALFAAGVDCIVLAHHQDDQAETLLLQLLRGAGLKGLSAMASQDADRRMLRPLLDISRVEIEAYAKAAQLTWIEDESNLDKHYDRNYCRHEVIPVLKARFPAASATLARSASHIAEAANLLDELAQIDAEACLVEGRMHVELLARLGLPRAKNLFRWWLGSMGFSAPSKDRLDDMLTQLINASGDATLKILLDKESDTYLHRYQGFVYIESNLPVHAAEIAMIWQGEDRLTMPDRTQLVFERKRGEGLAIDRLGGHKLRIASRQGGERFKPDLARPTRTLKHLLQEANVPPWLRDRLPLIYLDDTLAVVPNIGVDCMMQANEMDIGLVITWVIDTKI